jgi:hypothetical protein
MNYQEAQIRCEGCRFAVAHPIRGENSDVVMPDDSAVIYCNAPVVKPVRMKVLLFFLVPEKEVRSCHWTKPDENFCDVAQRAIHRNGLK